MEDLLVHVLYGIRTAIIALPRDPASSISDKVLLMIIGGIIIPYGITLVWPRNITLIYNIINNYNFIILPAVCKSNPGKPRIVPP